MFASCVTQETQEIRTAILVQSALTVLHVKNNFYHVTRLVCFIIEHSL